MPTRCAPSCQCLTCLCSSAPRTRTRQRCSGSAPRWPPACSSRRRWWYEVRRAVAFLTLCCHDVSFLLPPRLCVCCPAASTCASTPRSALSTTYCTSSHVVAQTRGWTRATTRASWTSWSATLRRWGEGRDYCSMASCIVAKAQAGGTASVQFSLRAARRLAAVRASKEGMCHHGIPRLLLLLFAAAGGEDGGCAAGAGLPGGQVAGGCNRVQEQPLPQLLTCLSWIQGHSTALPLAGPAMQGHQLPCYSRLSPVPGAEHPAATIAPFPASTPPQVGATPEGVEKPRCLRDAKLRELAAGMPPEHAPTIPTGADVKVGCGRRAGGLADVKELHIA